MLIDWFTVGAQTLNFLILVWLMKRFLYQPVLNAISAREKLIADELRDASAKKTEAQQERDDFRKKNQEFEQQREGLLRKAMDDAEGEHTRLLEQARAAADILASISREALTKQANDFKQAIARRAQQEVFAITRKALTDLAGATLEERMSEVFISRLRGMEGGAKESLRVALNTGTEPAVVRSAFDMPAAQRAAIQIALNETFCAQIRIRFETSPELVSGIEVTANGQKVAWSINDYVTSLEKDVDELAVNN